MSTAAVWSMPVTAGATRDALADETSLVAAARDGDGEAFGELVRRHQQRVFRLAGRFFRRPEEVEEAAQETFVRAWEKLATYRGDAPFEHWLTRVCLNCCYGRFRRRREEEVPLVSDVGRLPPDPTARLESEALLARLGAADRFVLLLLHGEGWSVAEIAERLDWSRAKVKVRAHRARKRLKRLLEGDMT